VVGAEIKLQQAGEPMVVRVTDIEGNFVAKLLKRGVYSVEVVVDGVVKLREVVKLARGRMSYKKWKV